MGLRVAMLTGDTVDAARRLGSELGIDEIRAGALPGHKVDFIKALQAEGNVVAMIGDGINDAPALSQADVGIAVGAGTEIAIAEADMILVKSRLVNVVTALDLSRFVFRRIKLNFLWAIGYNAIGIPVAAGVLVPLYHTGLPPVCAGLAMAFSSVSVVVSSLLLRLYRRPPVCNPAGEGATLSTSAHVYDAPAPERRDHNDCCSNISNCVCNCFESQRTRTKDSCLYQRLNDGRSAQNVGAASG